MKGALLIGLLFGAPLVVVLGLWTLQELLEPSPSRPAPFLYDDDDDAEDNELGTARNGRLH
jgi:hypothetical protein